MREDILREIYLVGLTRRTAKSPAGPAIMVVITNGSIRTIQEGQRQKFQEFKDLPKQVQKALAMLRMVEPGGELKDVGKRINEKEYWIYIWKKK